MDKQRELTIYEAKIHENKKNMINYFYYKGQGTQKIKKEKRDRVTEKNYFINKIGNKYYKFIT